MLTKRKKIVVLVVMFALLAATAVLNYTLALGANANGGTPDDGSITTGNFFTNYRSERVAARNEEIAYLDEIIAMEGEEYAAQRQEAAESKMKLVQILELETTLENILKAQGYEDAVVTIGLLSDNVNVVVKSGAELSQEESNRIYNLIFEEANVSPDYVRIIPV